MQQDTHYEVIIIGGSYAGLAAGMALGRALRKVLIIDSGLPCNRQTPHSHNFLTNDGKTPAAIAALAREQVSAYDTVHFLDAWVTAATEKDSGFEVQVQNKDTFTADKLVFATGIRDLLPEIPGFAESWGISVLHCPYCHGYEVRHLPTGILANGDTAFEMGALIDNWTSDLAIYTNGDTTLTDVQEAKLRAHDIAINTAAIHHLEHEQGQVKAIVFEDGTKTALQALYARLPFVQHSSIPASLGCALTPEGYIQVDVMQRTSVPGVYACGDNTSRLRTVANAVAMGTAAGMMLNKELIEEHF